MLKNQSYTSLEFYNEFNFVSIGQIFDEQFFEVEQFSEEKLILLLEN